MKPLKIMSLAVVILGLCVSPALAENKIAVVDIQKCVQLTAQGKTAYKDLKGEVDKIQDDLAAKEREIEDIRAKLEKGGSVLSESTRINLESELRRKSRSYRDLYEDSQARIRGLEMERTRPIFNRVVALVKEIGKAKGLDMVINSRAGLVYFAKTVEITDEVIAAYDKKYPGGGDSGSAAKKKGS